MSKAAQDLLFPSGSIGKAAAGHLQRTPSRESLNAHPLLANTPALHATSSSTSLKPDAAPPKYVPYTPRHRPPPSSATTSTSNQPASSLPVHQAGHTNATSMLHLQNMKATAQSIGVGAGTVGWAILEKLTDTESGAEWDDIWCILISLKPMVLLPLEPYSGEVITPDLVKDHIVFWGSLNPSFVTYSGMMGTLASGVLTFQSSMDTNSSTFINLLKPDHQSSVLLSLPPLSTFKYHSNDLPSFVLPEHITLQVHPRLNKPPLPPRPPTSTSTTKPSGPRIVNPFASLFGRPTSSSSTNRPTSPAPSISSFTDELSSQPQSSIEIRAYSVGKKIVKTSILSQLTKIYNNELKTRLKRCPQRVKNQIYNLTLPFVQFKASSPSNRNKNRSVPLLSLSMDGNGLSDAFQVLYEKIKDDLTNEKDFSGDESEDASCTGQAFSDEKVKMILDEVETTLCELFYDRLFCPAGGDDLSHDDALANRIAGLNMLDLGLEHLGVEVPNKAVQASALQVVQKCGAILQKLEDVEYRSPARKASLLVEAHKSIVDGLSHLPKLRLKPEGEDVDLQLPTVISQEEFTPPGSLTPPEMTVVEYADTENVQSQDSETLADIGADQDASGNDATKQMITTTVSGDVLFPFLIYSVVKANPPRFVSHLLYTERFRSPDAKGEEKYCLINLMAVVEFLEHVDMTALGLGDTDRVMSTEDLSPITLARSSADLNLTKTLGRRVNQQVGELAELAGSAGKMVTGVVDTSFGVLRGFLGNSPDAALQVDTAEITPWGMVKPSFGLLRRVSIRRPKTPNNDGPEEELVEVASRPGSIRGSDVNDDNEEDIAETSDDDAEQEIDTRDTRSIRSFSSMMSKESRVERATLADRLAKMSANAKLREPKPSLPSSMTTAVETITIPPVSNAKLKIPPPNQRFLECNERDLRIGEVAELLQEYRQVIQALRSAGFLE